MASELGYLSSGEGESYRLIGGDVITVKVTGEQTDGMFALFETITPPMAGPPPHIHHRERETFYVIEGALEFRIGEAKVSAGPGAVLVAPRDVPHSFRNVGHTPSKLLFIAQPAGFEGFVREFASLNPDAPPDFKCMKAIGEKYGIEFLT